MAFVKSVHILFSSLHPASLSDSDDARSPFSSKNLSKSKGSYTAPARLFLRGMNPFLFKEIFTFIVSLRRNKDKNYLNLFLKVALPQVRNYCTFFERFAIKKKCFSRLFMSIIYNSLITSFHSISATFGFQS